ncbi:FecCD family ABC transporter permease [Dietzia sp.]|uniref:FecCD family ABC transporter permease n=1 Tax=Dietzia sp. TaxID=1871616 RepID=UPI002FDB6927
MSTALSTGPDVARPNSLSPTSAGTPLALVIGIAAAAFVVAAVASLFLGARWTSVGDVIGALLAGPHAETSDIHILVWDLRFPRTVLAAAAGASLAVAGAFSQSWTRNPLADPGIIGITSGASFVVALFYGFGLAGGAWGAFGAIIGAAAVAAVVVLTTRRTQDPISLILVGFGLTTALGAGSTLVALQSSSVLDAMRQWVVGSTVGRGGTDIAIALTGLLIGLALAACIARPMDVLALGDDAAAGLGSSPTTTRTLAGVVVVVLAGLTTAAVGPIVFVGFAAPHLVRRFTGPSLTRMLVPVALTGAAVTVLGDIVGRLVFQPGELEVSVVLAFFGAPLLILAVSKGVGR